MFHSRKRELMMKMLGEYRPTSKSSLKSFCIMAADGDVEKAERLYSFYIKDMEELPMFDPKQPTAIDNAKSAVTGFFDFIKENKEGIGQVYDVVRSIAAVRGKNLPSMGGAAEKVAEALPSIN